MKLRSLLVCAPLAACGNHFAYQPPVTLDGSVTVGLDAAPIVLPDGAVVSPDVTPGTGDVTVLPGSDGGCAGTLRACGAVCVDVRSDTANCGACGVRCASGVPCNGGVCSSTACPTGQLACLGVCTDVSSSETNCGACARACETGAVCVAGECRSACNPPLQSCSGTCVDTASNPRNCGTCGNVCGAGATCSDSACRTSCTSPNTDCSGACVDTRSNAGNCGTCGNACAAQAHASAVCSGSVCGNACLTGYGDCNGFTSDGCETNLRTSATNCGVCGNECPAGQTCSGGACVSGTTATSYTSTGLTTLSSANFLDACALGGTVLAFSSQDDGASAISLPFSFSLYDRTYTTAYAGTNGVLAFAASNTEANPVCPSAATGASLYTLFPFWEDLYIASTARACVYTAGSTGSRRYVVTWKNVGEYAGTGVANPVTNFTFSVVLEEASGVIEYQYGSLTFMSAVADAGAARFVPSIGIRGGATTDAVDSSCSTLYRTPTSYTKIRYVPVH